MAASFWAGGRKAIKRAIIDAESHSSLFALCAGDKCFYGLLRGEIGAVRQIFVLECWTNLTIHLSCLLSSRVARFVNA